MDMPLTSQKPTNAKTSRHQMDEVKVKTKFLGAEFEGEGPHNLIQRYYEQFVNAVLFSSKEAKVETAQAQSFIQRGFDQLFSKETIDSFLEAERYLRKIRGVNKREWPHVLCEWDIAHPEKDKEEEPGQASSALKGK